MELVLAEEVGEEASGKAAGVSKAAGVDMVTTRLSPVYYSSAV